MSKLSELIAELCPNGVKTIRLSELCDIKNGYTPSKSVYEYWNGDTTVPWFRMEDIRANGHILSDSIQHVTKDAAKNGKLFPKNSIILATTATIGEHALITADSLANQRFTYLTIREPLRQLMDAKFFYYYMYVVDEWCKKNVNVSGFASVNMDGLKKLEIPLPPLKIQQEIVKILDKFTQLQAELQAELELQLKRIKEIRNDVLCCNYMMKADRNSRLVRLGDIGKFERCTGLQKNDLVDKPGDGLSPCLHYGQIYTYYGQVADVSKSYCDNALAEKMVKAHKGDLVIATTSENLEDVGTPVVWNGNSDWAIGGETYVYRHNQNPIFLANQFMTHNFFKYKQMRQTGTKVVRLNDKALSEYQIWLPSIEVQNKIAKFLHAYDLLVNDISNGLPAEIKLRQQQYEYYRDELLSFKLTNV